MGSQAPPYNPASAPQYPPTSQPYPPTSQPQYAPTSQPYYPPTSQPQYPPTSQPGYGYPQNQQPPPSGKYPEPPPGYTAQQPMPQQHHQQSSMTTNSTTVIMAGGMAPQPQIVHQAAPPNYMALSWIVCLFFCWPIGIAAIMASSGVDSAVAVGNYAEAQSQSSRAKGLGIAGLVCGIIII
eukprot:TCONS_00058444-protein